VFVGSHSVHPILVYVSIAGVVLGAVYILRMVQRVFLGEFNLEKWGGLTEINLRETLTVVPLVLLTLWVGVYPKTLSLLMEATLENLVKMMAR
jgi:NADH-quinone oxidoreductase subunit M